MAFDPHKNFAYSTVLTAPSPADTGTSLVVQSGDGAKFPAVSFNATVWPAGVQPLTTNAEIVRVTAISTDTFTITRAQESSTARSIVVGDQIAATITAKTLTDAESHLIDAVTDVDTTTDPPTLSEVLKWNGTNWVPAAYNYEFAFSIATFSDGISDIDQLIGSGVWSAIAAITFTATYNNEPGGMTAEVALSGAGNTWASNLAMTPTTGPETNTEAVNYPAAAGGTVTFTLSQSADGTTDTETVQFNNTMRYGTNANGIGAQTEANVEALTEVAGPSESRSQTISNIATGASQYLTFSYADRLSDVAQVQRDSGFGYVTASFNSTATTLAPAIQTTGLTTVSNSVGFTEAFAAITSRLTDLTNGTNDFKLLTTATAINYIYWGELNVNSGADGAAVYTEANVENNTATQPGKVGSNSMSSRSMTVNATAGEYTYIAYPSRLGALTSIMIGGFESLTDFWIDHGSGTELAITNPEGYQENYYVYVSKNPGFTDPTTMTVTI